jgi:hypothetical protein
MEQSLQQMMERLLARQTEGMKADIHAEATVHQEQYK